MVSACPCSSNAITTTPAPYRLMRAAFCRKSSSPSFRLMELTTGFPCTHFRPARITDHFELSTIDGNAGDLRLGRDVVQELGHGVLRVEHAFVHVHVDQVGAAAHLRERDVGGFGVVAGTDRGAQIAASR